MRYDVYKWFKKCMVVFINEVKLVIMFISDYVNE